MLFVIYENEVSIATKIQMFQTSLVSLCYFQPPDLCQQHSQKQFISYQKKSYLSVSLAGQN
jgi:hypothetical protein